MRRRIWAGDTLSHILIFDMNLRWDEKIFGSRDWEKKYKITQKIASDSITFFFYLIQIL